MAEESLKLEGHKSLKSIKRIGNVTSAILLSVIGNVKDVPDESRLASYFGIVPRVSNSNQTEHAGHIHRRGSKLGRTALAQSALITARYNPYLRSFYQRVNVRRGAGMTRLWDPRPGMQASGSRSTARLRIPVSRTVLGSKGALRRAKKKAGAPCLLRAILPNDASRRRLRRGLDTEPFLRLAKDENQVAVDKTS